MADNLRPSIKRVGQIPLQLVLIVPFVVQIVAAVGITGWLAYRHGQASVTELALQVSRGISDRIREQVLSYLRKPHIFLTVNAAAIRNGNLNINDPEQLRSHLYPQIQVEPSVNYLYYGDQAGNFLGVDREPTGQITLKVRNAATAPQRLIYELDNQGKPGKLLERKPFDPRNRPWYLAAVKTQKSTWSEIFISAQQQILQIAAVTPVMDAQGRIQGVLGANLVLEQISSFMQQLEISETGIAFIIEPSGDLVANSTREPPARLVNGKQQRLTATESSQALIRETAAYLQSQLGQMVSPTSRQLTIKVNDQPVLVQVSPLRDQYGLNWLVVVAIPEADFMEQIRANSYITLLWCFLALTIAVIVGILTTRWITRPILQLMLASQDIAAGNLEQSTPLTNNTKFTISELYILGQSFGQMADQLRISFDILEQRVRERTNELQLLFTVMQAIGNAPDFSTALETALCLIGENTHWDYGEARIPTPDGRGLICCQGWYWDHQETPDVVAALHRFRQYSQKLVFAPNCGLPGRVWMTAQPEWIPDVSIESVTNSVRAQQAKDCGLKAELGVPIVADGNQANQPPKVLAVLIFFMRESRQQDQQLIKLVSTVAAQLGTVMQKKQAEAELRAEQEKSERLLLNILPETIAQRLKQSQMAIAEQFNNVTILFADIVGFTQLSSQIGPQELVKLLNSIFSLFDQLCEQHKLEKIKTIGDAYMVVGGLPNPRADHAFAIAEMALDMQQATQKFRQQRQIPISIRIGINTGPVVAGVIGTKKFIYDLWGDTVNVASRMESHGEPGRIQVTEETYAQIRDKYMLEKRGIITVKGKGQMLTYWLQSRKDEVR